MRVDHRGLHAAVAEQFLNRADVVARLKQMRGKGVPKGMACRSFRDARPHHGLAKSCTVVRRHFGPPRHGPRAAVFDRRQHTWLEAETGLDGKPVESRFIEHRFTATTPSTLLRLTSTKPMRCKSSRRKPDIVRRESLDCGRGGPRQQPCRPRIDTLPRYDRRKSPSARGRPPRGSSAKAIPGN